MSSLLGLAVLLLLSLCVLSAVLTVATPPFRPLEISGGDNADMTTVGGGSLESMSGGHMPFRAFLSPLFAPATPCAVVRFPPLADLSGASINFTNCTIDLAGHRLQILFPYHYTSIPAHWDSEPDTLHWMVDGEPNDFVVDASLDLVATTKLDVVRRCAAIGVPCCYIPYFEYFLSELPAASRSEIRLTSRRLPPVKPAMHSTKKRSVFFAYSNCDEQNFHGVPVRRKLLEALSRSPSLEVANMGRCYGGRGVSPPADDPTALIRDFDISAAYENEALSGYVTEKLLLPLVAGVVPVYFGAPDVAKYVNPESFIDARAFDSPAACVSYLETVDESTLDSLRAAPIMTPEQYRRCEYARGKGRTMWLIFSSLPCSLRSWFRPCALCATSHVTFVTFADGKRFSSKRIAAEARSSGYFDTVLAWEGDTWLHHTPFWSQHKNFIESHVRGYGYWIWKPYVICEALKTIAYGDLLVWCDSGNRIRSGQCEHVFHSYYAPLLPERSTHHDLICFVNQHDDNHFCKSDVQAALSGAKNDEPNQIAGGLLIMRKTPEVERLMGEWLRLIVHDDYHLVDDSKSISPDPPSFIEHRHDQTILGKLIKGAATSVGYDPRRVLMCYDNLMDGRHASHHPVFQMARLR